MLRRRPDPRRPGKKYLSTSLLDAEPVKPAYLTPEVELLGLRTFRRACRTCVDFEECSVELTAP